MPSARSRTSCRCSATSPRSRRATLGQLTFLSEELPVNRSASRESDSDWMTRAATSPLSSLRWLDEFAPAGWSGRMSPASCHLGLVTRQSRLTMQGMDGRSTSQKQVISTPSSTSFASAGIVDATGCLTLNMCEWPGTNEPSLSDGDVCSLSDILETTAVPSRYYLTAKACLGILRRAGKRGKELPPMLHRALSAVAGASSDAVKPEDKTPSSPK